ncbi:UNVERIFIED_CONTAM: hypothetical protein FKN15_070254 [Acipenser sinensis]
MDLKGLIPRFHGLPLPVTAAHGNKTGCFHGSPERLSGSLLSEDSDLSESSEEEPEDNALRTFQTSCSGTYWNENPPPQGKTLRNNIVRNPPGPAPGTTTVLPKDTWDLFVQTLKDEEQQKGESYTVRGAQVHILAVRRRWSSLGILKVKQAKPSGTVSPHRATADPDGQGPSVYGAVELWIVVAVEDA